MCPHAVCYDVRQHTVLALHSALGTIAPALNRFQCPVLGSMVVGQQPAEGAGAVDHAGMGHACESKLHALVKELKAMRQRDSTAKALIFSQYK